MKTRLIKGLLGVLVLAVSVLSAGGLVSAAELADRIVAIVNDDVITLSELNEAVVPYVQKIRGERYSPDTAREMRFKVREQVLNRMVDDLLTAQEAKRLNISVEQSEVDEYVERTKSQHALTEEDLRKALAGQGLTLEQYRKQLKEQILQLKIINVAVKSKVAVTEKDIQEYYESHKDDYQSEKKYHLKTIVMDIPASATDAERDAARERMTSVERALKTGGAGAFDEMAERFSGDGTSLAGSDLGLFALDELSKKIREMVRGMKAGDVTPVLETPNGYQILMVQAIEEGAGKTLDDVRIEIQEQLHRKLVREKYETWVKKLRDRSYVRIMQ